MNKNIAIHATYFTLIVSEKLKLIKFSKISFNFSLVTLICNCMQVSYKLELILFAATVKSLTERVCGLITTFDLDPEDLRFISPV